MEANECIFVSGRTRRRGLDKQFEITLLGRRRRYLYIRRSIDDNFACDADGGIPLGRVISFLGWPLLIWKLCFPWTGYQIRPRNCTDEVEW